MLKEIWIENFKSVNEGQLFSMEASPENEISEFPCHLIRLKDTNLLKVATMYGPNGGGKSNLLEAFYVLKRLVKSNKFFSDSPTSETFYSSVFSQSKITKFIVVFENVDYEIKYEINADISNSNYLDRGRLVAPIILKEEMVYLDKNNKDSTEVIYSRDSNGIVKSHRFKDLDLVKTGNKLAFNLSFASYVVTTFNNTVRDERCIPIFNFASEIDSIGVLKREPRNWGFAEDVTKQIESKKEIVIKSLNNLDINVCDLFFKKSEIMIDRYDLYIVRGINNIKKSIPLSKESNGTKKLIAILLDILLETNNRIYLADDFDAYLHPKLIGAILDLFNSKENNNKQIIFNSHDIINMNNKHFRRDEIWFAFRDEKNQTIYLPLSNIYDYKGNQIRKDAKYGKQYLEGRYGADPFIKDGLNWGKR